VGRGSREVLVVELPVPAGVAAAALAADRARPLLEPPPVVAGVPPLHLVRARRRAPQEAGREAKVVRHDASPGSACECPKAPARTTGADSRREPRHAGRCYIRGSMSASVPTAARPPVHHGLRAFRHRDFRLYFTGQLVSLIGSWMQSVAQGWLMH